MTVLDHVFYCVWCIYCVMAFVFVLCVFIFHIVLQFGDNGCFFLAVFMFFYFFTVPVELPKNVFCLESD